MTLLLRFEKTFSRTNIRSGDCEELMVHLTITPAGVNLSPGGEVILRHQTWADYEDLLECRGDNAAVKVH